MHTPTSLVRRASLPAFILGGLLAASSAYAALSTVGVINPDAATNLLTVVDSTTNTGNSNFLTVAAMGTQMTTAFANNTGGVINFNTTNGWSTTALTSATVTYGNLQSNSLTLTYAGVSGDVPTSFAEATVSTQTSNGGHLAFSGGGGGAATFSFSFDKGLSAWGITQLARSGARTVTMSFTLQDTTVVNFAADTVGDNSATVTWYGFQATDANPITKVTISDNGLTRFDDMAFVTASAIPEPSTYGIAAGGLALVGAMVARRRQAKN